MIYTIKEIERKDPKRFENQKSIIFMLLNYRLSHLNCLVEEMFENTFPDIDQIFENDGHINN